MINLLIISLITIPCLATNIHDDNQSESCLIRRYTELCAILNDDLPSNKLTLAQTRDILDEMASIERKTKALESGRGDVVEKFGIDHINRYQSLVDASYRSSVIIKSDATITDLLLQTFEYDSNNCDAKYFNHLSEIGDIFEHLAISVALQENSEHQYKNCWTRLMRSLNVLNSLIGLRYLDPLSDLTKSVYRDAKVVKTQPHSNKSLLYRIENTRIAVKIRQFLAKSGDRNDTSYNEQEFQHRVVQTCQYVIDRTREIMMDVHELLRLSGSNRHFISSDDALILNRYTLCDRIVNDTDFIKSNASKDLHQVEQSGEIHQEFGRRVDLITQQELLNLNEHPQLEPGTFTELQLEPAAKRYRINRRRSSRDSSARDQHTQLEPNSDSVRPMAILKCIGRGASAIYPTIWPDGSTTLETRQKLVGDYHDVWLEFFRRRQCEWQSSYMARLRCQNSNEIERKDGVESGDGRAQLDLNLIDPNHAQECVEARTVLKISRPDYHISMGQGIRYPTVWSDGSKTFESKAYLESNWIGPWTDFVNYTREYSRQKYLKKKRKRHEE